MCSSGFRGKINPPPPSVISMFRNSSPYKMLSMIMMMLQCRLLVTLWASTYKRYQCLVNSAHKVVNCRCMVCASSSRSKCNVGINDWMNEWVNKKQMNDRCTSMNKWTNKWIKKDICPVHTWKFMVILFSICRNYSRQRSIIEKEYGQVCSTLINCKQRILLV